MALTVLHLSTYTSGGAGRAEKALHQAMQKQGLSSSLLSGSGTRFGAARFMDRQLWRLQRSPVATWRSPARFGSMSAAEINRTDADVVNLHWVTAGLLSIEEIGRIQKPVVWSLYDMWPFCGTEHYGVDQPEARWRTGYTRDNRPAAESGLDIDRDAWQRKVKHWVPAPVVPASTWLREATEASALMSTWPITQIPHVIDTDAFVPQDRAAARERLQLESWAPMILFLSSAGTKDARKGFDLLEAALPAVHKAVPNVRLLVVGPKDDERSRIAGVPVIWFGGVEGNDELCALYSAADVTVVPSREDNMPLTAMEAQTCGRAVVGFHIGGLPDIVVNHQTGYLATPGDAEDLGVGLIQALQDSFDESTWGVAARARAESTWSVPIVVRKYQDVYEGALA